jgi:hypothetical protein
VFCLQDGFPLWKRVLAGLCAGGFGQLVASPTDLIKTQIQMEGKRRLQVRDRRGIALLSVFVSEEYARYNDV